MRMLCIVRSSDKYHLTKRVISIVYSSLYHVNHNGSLPHYIICFSVLSLASRVVLYNCICLYTCCYVTKTRYVFSPKVSNFPLVDFLTWLRLRGKYKIYIFIGFSYDHWLHMYRYNCSYTVLFVYTEAMCIVCNFQNWLWIAFQS